MGEAATARLLGCLPDAGEVAEICARAAERLRGSLSGTGTMTVEALPIAEVAASAQPAGFVRVGTIAADGRRYMVHLFPETGAGTITREHLEDGHGWSTAF